MPDTSRVSVVIPCWRCAATLPRAVASVLSQSLLPLEVILVDDGNSDDTPAVISDIASRSPRLVRVVTLPANRGPGEARNAGWEAAHGELVAFLDADDAWHPRKLEVHLSWLAGKPEVVVSGHKSRLCRDGEAPIPVEPRFAARRIGLCRLLLGDPLQMRTVIVRRDVALRFVGRHSEDYHLWLRLTATGAQCYVLDVALACTFRPEFSAGGHSAALWTHEKGELAALSAVRRNGGINIITWSLASVWSMIKFVRRVFIVRWRAKANS